MQRYTVYFIWKLLYMFPMVPPPIIRSANSCIYSIWYLSHRYCYLPLSWKNWNWFECAVGGVHPQRLRERIVTVVIINFVEFIDGILFALSNIIWVKISAKYSNICPTRRNVTQFILSGNCSTCSGWYHHPSSRAKNNCIYSIWYLSHRCCYLPLSWKSWSWFACATHTTLKPVPTLPR